MTPKVYMPQSKRSGVIPSSAVPSRRPSLTKVRTPQTPIFPTPSKISKASRYGNPVVIDLTRPQTPQFARSPSSVGTPCPPSKSQGLSCTNASHQLHIQGQNLDTTLGQNNSARQQRLEAQVTPQEVCTEPPRTPPASTITRKTMAIVPWQASMALHLHQQGDLGPFEIGDFLCTFEPGTGKCLKEARKTPGSSTEEALWTDVKTGEPYQSPTFSQGYSEVYGNPVRGPFDSFAGFEHLQSPPRAHLPTADEVDGERLKSFRLDDDPMLF